MGKAKQIIGLGAIATLLISLSYPAIAQEELRNGVLQFSQLEAWSMEGSTTLSRGVLADLRNDPYFVGDFDYIYSVAANILNGYTIVQRGGFFPENAGIPREQQLTVAEAAYHIFSQANGTELVLFRSPMEDTSRYFIRTTENQVMTR